MGKNITYINDFIKDHGPKDGHIFLLDIDDLLVISIAIAAIASAMAIEGKSFSQLPIEEKEEYVRIALTCAEASKNIIEKIKNEEDDELSDNQFKL